MKKKVVAIFTTTRAEFGAFKPFIEEIIKSSELEYLLFVGGAHLVKEYGNTINEIKAQGYKIADEFDYIEGENSAFSISNSMGKETKELSRIFRDYSFDAVCIAGDRYELIPIALTATLFKKPIVHMYGGESTEGVIDEQIRHMLTKAAQIHFTSCELHSENVRRMGEESWRVFTTGELVVDNMAQVKKIEKQKIYSEFNLDVNKKTFLFTYHPVTLDNEMSAKNQLEIIFEAVKKFDVQVMMTAPNVEVGSDEVFSFINDYVSNNAKIRFCKSLGFLKYYSFLEAVDGVIGNSSSGILEAPFFKVPSLNIGRRQEGRIRHQSVVDANLEFSEIEKGILKILDPSFRKSLSSMEFKLGDGHAGKKMVKILESIDFSDKKIFHKKLVFN